jgi:predicted alpha/beta superfamily hydrolase
MKFSIRTYLLIVSLLFVQVLSSCAPQSSAVQTPQVQSAQPQSDAFPRVTIPESEVRQLESSATGRSYDIYVRLPSSYALNQKQEYPILYVLDGQWDFKLLDSIYGGLEYDGFVPEMIIVSITYSGEDPDYGSLRAMDYTPMQDRFVPGSGDAPKFFSFLKEELIPFIETEYEADPSRRILMGHSFGGIFTLYAMFREPELFSGYVSASPAIVFGETSLFPQEAAYASEHQDLPVRLFLSVGELEELARPVQEFMQVLSERGYPGLIMETRIIEGERHAGNKPEAYNRGLRFVFSR